MAEPCARETCPGCQGWGRTWKGTGWDMMTCPVCQGEGQVEALPPEPPLWLVALIVILVLGLAFFGLLAVDVLGGGQPVSLQHAAIQLLNHASQTLDGLAGAGVHPKDCSYASVKLARAARRLQVEPLHTQDVAAAFREMQSARPSIQVVWDAKVPKPQLAFVTLTCSAYNAAVELLEGLKSFPEQVSLDHPQAGTLQARLRRLLPAGWWGSHD